MTDDEKRAVPPDGEPIWCPVTGKDCDGPCEIAGYICRHHNQPQNRTMTDEDG